MMLLHVNLAQYSCGGALWSLLITERIAVLSVKWSPAKMKHCVHVLGKALSFCAFRSLRASDAEFRRRSLAVQARAELSDWGTVAFACLGGCTGRRKAIVNEQPSPVGPQALCLNSGPCGWFIDASEGVAARSPCMKHVDSLRFSGGGFLSF